MKKLVLFFVIVIGIMIIGNSCRPKPGNHINVPDTTSIKINVPDTTSVQ